MITSDYSKAMTRVSFYGVGAHKVEQLPDGTYKIDIDINEEELRTLYERLIYKLDLLKLKEGGLPV